MCITNLKTSDLENLKEYNSQSKPHTITYTYFFEPILSKLIVIFPISMTPNIFSLLSLIFTIFPLCYLTYDEAYNDFDWVLDHKTVKVVTICQFLYIITSNLYLVQLDRINQFKNSSSFIVLFGYWTDITNAIFICFTLSHILLLGNDGPYSTMVFVAMYITYYSSVYEEYAFGEFHSSYFNLSTEVAIGVFIIECIASWFDIMIFSVEIWKMTLGDWIALGIIIGGVHCALMSWLNIFMDLGVRKVFIGAIDLLCFYNVIIVPAVLSEIDFRFYKDFYWLIMLTSSLLFARQLADMQVKILTKQKLSMGIAVIIINVALPFTFFYRNYIYLLVIFTLSCVWLAIELSVIVVVRSIEFLCYLKVGFVIVI